MFDNNKILVVEDELKIRDVITMYLKKEGFTVLETGNGKEALTLIEKEKPALIIPILCCLVCRVWACVNKLLLF